MNWGTLKSIQSGIFYSVEPGTTLLSKTSRRFDLVGKNQGLGANGLLPLYLQIQVRISLY